MPSPRLSTNYRAIPDGAIKIDLPNTFQLHGYTCGAAALLSICSYYGVGPEEEWDVADDMNMTKAGTDPADVIAALVKYGLCFREFRPMTKGQIRRCLDLRRPVMIMLQAWGDRASYRDAWHDGHWVIAIGYDDRGFYFEDPSISGARGFLSSHELDERWHDIEGVHQVQTPRYGIAIWKPGIARSAFDRLARVID
jgi:predicted double-glycine peptidase